MESYHNALTGKYERLVLERRVLDRPLASGDGSGHARGIRRRGPGRHPEPGAARRHGRPAGPSRADARAAQSPRLGDSRFLPAVRRDDRLSELQRLARRSRRGPGPACALPLLQLHGTGTGEVSTLRRSVPPADGFWHRARRTRNRARLPRPSCGASGPRFDSAEGCVDRSARPLSGRRHRRPRRDPDDREGPRFPRRDARRRRVGGCGTRCRRFPCVGTDVPAPDAGRRPCRPRRTSWRSHRADALSSVTTASSWRAVRIS